MIIGICGKSGSGKSTLAKEIVSKYGEACYVDIDSIGHNVLKIPEVKDELVRNFGESILLETDVDRKKLGNMVFNSRKDMKVLSDITWKHMKIKIDEILSSNRNKIIVVDWILLPITEYFSRCDITIFLDVPFEVRKKRAMLRDGISEEAFILRESASIDFEGLEFDYVINGDMEEFVKGLVKLL